MVVTCIPLAVIGAFCLFLWFGGSELDHLMGTEIWVSTTTRLRVAGLVTVMALIAAAATWIVLIERRLSVRRLRRLLTAVLVVDLVLFNCFVIRPPTTESKAQALGPMSAALGRTWATARFIIYDPDQFETGQLYQLGQTDLNIYAGLPSGQGYTALTDGEYYDATGAHFQEDLNPSTLAGSHLGRPQRLHPALPARLLPHPAAPTRPRAHGGRRCRVPGPHQLVRIPADAGGHLLPAVGRALPDLVLRWGADWARSPCPCWPAGPGTSEPVWSLPPGGPVAAGRPRAPRSTPTGTPRSRSRSHPRCRRPGLVVEPTARTGVTVGTPTAFTAQTGEVALDGRMQYGVTTPHWVFTGTLGTFAVFHNTEARGWAWVRSPAGGDPATRQLGHVRRRRPERGPAGHGARHLLAHGRPQRVVEHGLAGHRPAALALARPPGHRTGPAGDRAPVRHRPGGGAPGPRRLLVTFTYLPGIGRGGAGPVGGGRPGPGRLGRLRRHRPRRRRRRMGRDGDLAGVGPGGAGPPRPGQPGLRSPMAAAARR